MNIHDLKSVGYVRMPHGESLTSSVQDVVTAWRVFCAMDEVSKKKLEYRHLQGLGVGYELKTLQGATLDQKEDFHFNLKALDALRIQAQSAGAAAEKLIECAIDHVQEISPIVQRFAAEAEKAFSLEGFEEEVMDGKDQWLIRLLNYFGGRNAGDQIAMPHPDKSGFTLNEYESDEGLEILGTSFQWHKVAHIRGSIAVNPGLQMQYRAQGEIEALYHRVVATERTARIGRVSMVTFIPLIRTPRVDKARIGRTQDKPIGFNYGMPFEEFAKLFTSA